MKTYTIAMIGDMLAATAVDGDDAMMSERLADTLTQITEGDSTDVKYITGLTLYATVDDAEDDGAEVVYSGSDMGWLEDASGAMGYDAAGLKPVSLPFASCLNEAGQAHVAAELNRLGLNWSVSGTCSEIEDKPGFMDLTSGSSYDYEISNSAAGKRSYGAFGFIEILADKHVAFEVCE